MKVVVRVSDGLGNQLFEYALGKYVSGILGCSMVFDISHFIMPKSRIYQLDRFSGPAKIRRWGILREYFFLVVWAFKVKIGENRFREILTRLGMTWIKIENPFAFQHAFDVESIRLWRGTVYVSDCYGHIPHMPSRDALKELLTIVEPPSAANRRYIDDMRSFESVSVHVRRTDYLLACNNSPALDVSYQRKAMDVMRRKVGNPRWFIFSDDIEWCRKEFADVENAVFVSGNESCPWEDIRLMSVCRHHIIANSTFSWWGAYLGDDDGIVLYPTPWFKGLEMPRSGVPEGRSPISV